MQQTWDVIWKNFKGLNWFGRRFKKEEEKTLNRILDSLNFSKNSRIIDIGCGTGYVLNFFRKKGYKNAVGIDNSRNAIFLCKKLFNLAEGKDVFLMDGSRTNFSKNHFDLVFSEGLLEHFENPMQFVKEMCRLSKRFVLLVQPNPSSVFGRIKNLLPKLMHVSWEREYKYDKEDYVNMFSKLGFVLKNSGSINFNEVIWFLFERG